MQEVVIKIKGDSSDIIKLGNELKNLGKIDQDNAKQFKKTNDDFKKGAKESKSALSEVFSEITDIRGQLINVGKGIVAAFAVEAVINFGKESVKAFMEAELNAKKLSTAIKTIGGEGEQSFQKLINQSEELQAKGIFSDDAIQSAQTQLAQFGLLSNEIESILPLIADMAAATGMDLGQATDTVIQGINGMTRGLRPLGLEFKDTGSKAENFLIIQQKLGKFQGQMDSVMDTSAGKLTNLANKWDDFKETVGGAILWFIENHPLKTISELGKNDYADEVTKQFNAQVEVVSNLQNNIIPLADRYDELQKKTKLSNVEQSEMKRIIEEISLAIPSAVSATDDLGKAIAVNTTRVREFVNAEIARLRVVNKQAIEENSKNLKEAQRRKAADEDAIRAFNAGKAQEFYTKQIQEIALAGGNIAFIERKVSQQWIQTIRDRYAKAAGEVLGYQTEIQRLNGDYLQKEFERQQQEAKIRDEQRAADEAAAAAEKAKAGAKQSAAKANIQATKEELTTLEKLKKIYTDLDVAVQKNVQNGIIDLELIKKRDLAEREYIGFNMEQVGRYIDLVYKKDVANREFTEEEFARGEEQIANDDKVLAEKKKNAEKEIDLNKEKNDKIKEDNEKAAREREELAKAEDELGWVLMEQSVAVLSAIQRNGYEQDVRELDKKLKNQQISQEEYDKQLRKMKYDQAVQDKIYASYNIVLNTAQAVVRAYAESAIAGPILATTAAIIGAAQLAIAVAAPLPEYAKGTAFLKRGKNKPGIDTIPVMANEGEAIIPTEKNAEHPGLAEAWIKGNLEQYVHNKFVIPALRTNNKGRDDAAFIDKLAKSISLNAAFNDGNLLESDKMSRRLLMEQNNLLKRIANGSNKNPYRF